MIGTIYGASLVKGLKHLYNRLQPGQSVKTTSKLTNSPNAQTMSKQEIRKNFPSIPENQLDSWSSYINSVQPPDRTINFDIEATKDTHPGSNALNVEMWITKLAQHAPSFKTSIVIDKKSKDKFENTPISATNGISEDISPTLLKTSVNPEVAEYLIQEALKKTVDEMIWDLD
ncbi:MAG: hypothetical protein QNJ31_08755 [Candidatus Caenarcaniphilales bacterium]|nr:hypothetical protein [Candidatus Caenarcaniphilales bacterium]